MFTIVSPVDRKQWHVHRPGNNAMSSRWFNIAVLMLWLATMSWLVTEKVLPPLLLGEPPKLQTVLADAADTPEEPVSWQLILENRPLGWATSETVRLPDDVVELRSRVHLDRFPLAELAPGWLTTILEPLGSRDGELTIDTESTVEVAAGRLQAFHTKVDLGPLEDALFVRGTALAGQLHVTVRAGEFKYNTKAEMPGDSLLGDGLSPRAKLARLKVGQTWTEPIYSPFHPPNSPLQIVEALVEREEPLTWNGKIVNTSVVVYRNDSGSELSGSRVARGRAWVRRDGDVLKQELMMFGSRLVFIRLPPGQSPEAPPIAEAAGVAVPADSPMPVTTPSS